MARRKEAKVPLVVETQLKDSIKKLNKLDNNIDDIAKSGKNVNKVFSAAGRTLTGFVSVYALKQAAEYTVELAKMADAARQVELPFKRLVQLAGKDSIDALNNLRKAVNGTASDVELMQRAAQAMDAFTASGIKPAEAFESTQKTMEFLYRYSVKFGKDFNTVMRTVFTGLQRGSTLFLDDVGIMINQNDKMFKGLGPIEKKAKLVAVALEQMAIKNKTLGEVTEGTIVKQGQMSASLDNLKVALGKLIETPIDDFFNSAAKALHNFNDMISSTPEEQKAEKIKELTEAQEELAKINKDIQQMNSEGKSWFENLFDLDEAAEHNKKFYEEEIKNINAEITALDQLINKKTEVNKTGGGGGKITYDDAAAKKALKAAMQIAEQYDTAMQHIYQRNQQQIEDIDKQNEEFLSTLFDRNVAGLETMAETDIETAIATTDQLLEIWRGREEEYAYLLEYRQELIDRATEEELENAKRIAWEIGSIFEGPMQQWAADMAEGAKTGKEIWNDFFKDLKRQILEFITSQLVKTFLNILANIIVPGSGNVFGSLFSSGTGGGVGTGRVLNTTPTVTAEFNPLTQPAMALNTGSSTSIYSERVTNKNNLLQGKITIEAVEPDLLRVKDYHIKVNRDVNIPDTNYHNEFLSTTNEKSEFD